MIVLVCSWIVCMLSFRLFEKGIIVVLIIMFMDFSCLRWGMLLGESIFFWFSFSLFIRIFKWVWLVIIKFLLEYCMKEVMNFLVRKCFIGMFLCFLFVKLVIVIVLIWLNLFSVFIIGVIMVLIFWVSWGWVIKLMGIIKSNMVIFEDSINGMCLVFV